MPGKVNEQPKDKHHIVIKPFQEEPRPNQDYTAEKYEDLTKSGLGRSVDNNSK